jgi:hypothetical protein
MKQEATDVQPKDLTAIRQAPTITRHPVTSTVHTGATHEPIFTPELQVQLGLRQGNGEHYHGET